MAYLGRIVGSLRRTVRTDFRHLFTSKICVMLATRSGYSTYNMIYLENHHALGTPPGPSLGCSPKSLEVSNFRFQHIPSGNLTLLWKNAIFNGKIHCKCIAMLVITRGYRPSTNQRVTTRMHHKFDLKSKLRSGCSWLLPVSRSGYACVINYTLQNVPITDLGQSHNQCPLIGLAKWTEMTLAFGV